MKNKGFTLVELMAVIILLAIVTTIAYSSYRSVNKNIRKQQFENKISLIETKAAEYANDTKIMITNVDTLVKKGYLAADTEDDNVLSPIDNSSMNCYVFSMYKSEDNYYGEYLSEGEYLPGTNECDTSKLDIVNGNIIINKYVSVGGIKIEEEPLERNDWTNKDVWLEIQSNNSDINLDEDEIISVKWISQLGEETNNSTTKIVSASYLIDTTFTVEITIKNNENGENKYRAETLVRIDKARPNISKVEIENENVWTQEKKVIVNAHDEGSGIYGYAIVSEYEINDIDDICDNAEYTENQSEIYEDIISENGFYYICAKDKAGNVSNYDEKYIEYVDNEEPECAVWIDDEPNEYNWYNKDIIIRFDDGRDSEEYQSKIQEKNIFINGRKLEGRELKDGEQDGKYYWTLDYDTEGLSATIQVRDNAGNVCNQEIIEVNRDATKPSCTNWGDNSIWTNRTITIHYGCNDNLSGCLTPDGSKTYRTSTRTDTISSYTISDYAGNKTVCPSREANVYLDDCTSTRRVRTSTGACSKNCDGGIRTYTYNNVGTFSNEYVCSTGSDTESCNTQPCVVDASTKGATSSQSCTSSCHSGYCGACSGGCSYEDGWTETHNAWCDNCCCSETCSTVYSCPSGWTLSGTTCYSCPSGYYLSGSKCYWRT